MIMTPAATCLNSSSQKAPSCRVTMSKCPSLKGEHARREIEKQQMRVRGWGVVSEFLTKCPPTSHTAVEFCQERGGLGWGIPANRPHRKTSHSPKDTRASGWNCSQIQSLQSWGKDPPWEPPTKDHCRGLQGTQGPLDDTDVASPCVRIGKAVCGTWDLLYPRTGSDGVLPPLVRPLCPCTQSSRVNTSGDIALLCVDPLLKE